MRSMKTVPSLTWGGRDWASGHCVRAVRQPLRQVVIRRQLIKMYTDCLMRAWRRSRRRGSRGRRDAEGEQVGEHRQRRAVAHRRADREAEGGRGDGREHGGQQEVHGVGGAESPRSDLRASVHTIRSPAQGRRWEVLTSLSSMERVSGSTYA